MRAAIIVLLLLPAAVLAASVSTDSPGYPTRGTLENRFPFIPGDTTVVKGILPNDFIVISADDDELRLFFTRQLNNYWEFQFWPSRLANRVELEEQFPLDIDGDGSTDMLIEYTRQDLKKGVFTFTATGEPGIVPVEPEPSEPVPEPAVPEPPTIPVCETDTNCGEGYVCSDGLCTPTETDEEVVTEPPTSPEPVVPTPEPAEPTKKAGCGQDLDCPQGTACIDSSCQAVSTIDETTQSRLNYVIAAIIIAVVLYFLFSRRPKGFKGLKKHKKHKKAHMEPHKVHEAKPQPFKEAPIIEPPHVKEPPRIAEPKKGSYEIVHRKRRR